MSIQNLATTLGKGTTGRAKGVEKRTNHQPQRYTVVISGVDRTNVPDLIHRIASLYATDVTVYGKVTNKAIICSSCLKDLVKKGTKHSKGGQGRSVKSRKSVKKHSHGYKSNN